MLVTITVKAIQLATIFSPNSSIPLEKRTRLRPNSKKPVISNLRRAVVKLGHMFAREEGPHTYGDID